MREWANRIIAEIDRDDVFIGLGLVLVTVGLWAVVHVAALIAPGAVLLWVALPTRRSFLADPVADHRRKVS
jgi:hypothetical protein